MEMSKKMEKWVNAQIDKLMKTGFSYEDAYEIAVDDWRIDHPEKKGERLEWEPTLEEEKAMRKATKIVGKREVTPDKAKKGKAAPRKEDPAKRELIEMLFAAVAAKEGVREANVDNPERVVAFTFGGESYSITLTRHRAKK